ncbi:carbohydrate porin [Roseivirga sp. UBA1976]|uniref:carbohydrate porin n=1 Tax=Roseivirga sp. UBA1976 TaxID=1947386 RepID=UPI00257F842D|nr:carbohydrate porin [Roseivirga sp. UBA1976]MEC7756073.1 carbohydrate porin [Bacteroidota bacterium]|tara:strand:+ start:3491 stop:4621 length:1131 start_codon:yes stop_codon:yes gene_type:complete
MRRCAVYAVLCLLFVCNLAAQDQRISYENHTAYLTEILAYTSSNSGKDIHFIGWLLNTSQLNFPKGHSLNLSLALTHGGEPSANIVGDLQTFSNLEAGFNYGFFEVYYQYKQGDFWVKLGQVDINTDFLVSRNGLLFTHSSFGIDAVAAMNVPAPTYPVTGFSLTTQIPITELVRIKAGIFDGQFAMPRNNYLGINWALNEKEGLIYVLEPRFQLFKNRLVQKVGFYYHSGTFTDYTPGANTTTDGLSGLYLVSDLMLLQWQEKKKLSLFAQYNLTVKQKASLLDYYLGLGMKIDNLINSSRPNALGMAVAHAKVNTEYGNLADGLASETVLEINFKQEVDDWLSLQPYFHYIGMNEIRRPMKNPVVLALRAYIEF